MPPVVCNQVRSIVPGTDPSTLPNRKQVIKGANARAQPVPFRAPSWSNPSLGLRSLPPQNDHPRLFGSPTAHGDHPPHTASRVSRRASRAEASLVGLADPREVLRVTAAVRVLRQRQLPVGLEKDGWERSAKRCQPGGNGINKAWAGLEMPPGVTSGGGA